MTKDNQIEEMYKDVYEAIDHNAVIDIMSGGYIGINTKGLTGELYDQGYRKTSNVAELEEKVADLTANWQKIHNAYTADCIEHYNKGSSDVARRIISDLENSIDGLLKVYIEEREKECVIDTPLAEYVSGKIDAYSSVKFRLAELKKKYTEEGK